MKGKGLALKIREIAPLAEVLANLASWFANGNADGGQGNAPEPQPRIADGGGSQRLDTRGSSSAMQGTADVAEPFNEFQGGQ